LWAGKGQFSEWGKNILSSISLLSPAFLPHLLSPVCPSPTLHLPSASTFLEKSLALEMAFMLGPAPSPGASPAYQEGQ